MRRPRVAPPIARRPIQAPGRGAWPRVSPGEGRVPNFRFATEENVELGPARDGELHLGTRPSRRFLRDTHRPRRSVPYHSRGRGDGFDRRNGRGMTRRPKGRTSPDRSLEDSCCLSLFEMVQPSAAEQVVPRTPGTGNSFWKTGENVVDPPIRPFQEYLGDQVIWGPVPMRLDECIRFPFLAGIVDVQPTHGDPEAVSQLVNLLLGERNAVGAPVCEYDGKTRGPGLSGGGGHPRHE